MRGVVVRWNAIGNTWVALQLPSLGEKSATAYVAVAGMSLGAALMVPRLVHSLHSSDAADARPYRRRGGSARKRELTAQPRAHRGAIS